VAIHRVEASAQILLSARSSKSPPLRQAQGRLCRRNRDKDGAPDFRWGKDGPAPRADLRSQLRLSNRAPRKSGGESTYNSGEMIQVLNCVRWLLVIFLIYMGLMKEDQEGVWENRLEHWLKTVYAHQETSFAKITALAKAIADVSKKLTQRIFGTRLFSLRFLGVSILYGLASVNLTVLISPLVPHKPPTFHITLPPGAATQPDLFQHFVWLVLFLLLGSAPALFETLGRMSVWVWLLWTVFFVRWFFPLIEVETVVDRLWGHGSAFRFGIGLLLLVGLNYALDVLFVATTGWILGIAANARRLSGVIFATLLDIGLGYAVLVVPIWLGVKFFTTFNHSMMSFSLMFVFAFKSLDFLIALLVLILFLLIVIHAAGWFVLERPVYTCLRFKLIRDKKFVRSMIVALLTLPKVGTVWAFVIALVKAF
jgi:hypothetical protein